MNAISQHNFSRPRIRGASGGFTLLETMIALIIIAMGVLAFVDAQTAFLKSNNWSSQSATGMFLANEIREYSRTFSRHDPVTGLTLQGSGQTQTVVGWGRERSEVSAADLNDLDDLDGVTFGVGGTFPGPINGAGEVIPQISLTGETVTDRNSNAVSLEGWSQRVTVEKLDPYNFSTVRAHGYEQAATSSLPYIRVDQFPLRVTVSVRYQGLTDAQATEITHQTWVVIP
jgi:prepilin-type N-terminal cleavage/methylation domain-containing protein